MIKVDALDPKTLQSVIGADAPATDQLDDLGYELALQASDENNSGLGNLWEKVKAEFRVLLCTDDAKYDDVRKQADTVTSGYTTALVATISAALGATLGLAAAVIAPLVGLLLLALQRVGKNAICDLSWGS